MEHWPSPSVLVPATSTNPRCAHGYKVCSQPAWQQTRQPKHGAYCLKPKFEYLCEPQSQTLVHAMPVAERVAPTASLGAEGRQPGVQPRNIACPFNCRCPGEMVKQFKEGVLQYLPAYKFISRVQEAQHVKKDRPLVVDNDGNLKVSKSSDLGSCDNSSDLSLRGAPQGCMRVALSQIIAADRRLWTFASHNQMKNLHSSPGPEKNP